MKPEHRGAQDTGHRQRGNEQRNDVGLIALAEPISQIQDDTGEEAGFGNAKQKSHNIKLLYVLHGSTGHGHDAPSHQNASDPHPRPDAVKQKIAGHFKDEIAPKEDSSEQ